MIFEKALSHAGSLSPVGKLTICIAISSLALTSSAWSQAASQTPEHSAAQTSAPPAAPAPSLNTRVSAAPGTPAPTGTAPADPFPAPNLKFFTADSPTTATVDSFLHATWGYDTSRIWKVEAIQKTAAPGISRVTVYVAEKGANAKVQPVSFFVTPDGKHAILDSMIDFGVNPFAARRQMMQDRADGPATGASDKTLLFVEFADLQCPHCKDAQSTMKQLATDFPKARIVYQPFPLVNVHPAAFIAAAEGVCIAAKGSDAYLKYADAVYDTQASLTTPQEIAKTLAAAVVKAGQDPQKIADCAVTADTRKAVEASVQLAEDADVTQTPTLVVNGRILPLSQVPYDSLKKIILFQASLDGIHVDPPQPVLSTLPK